MNNASQFSLGSRPLWAIILSGGEGQRMRPFVEWWKGRPIPKQYCTFVGTRSMLQHTWDRAAHLTERPHTLTVVDRSHICFLESEIKGVSTPPFIIQPQGRDTAAGVFLPLTYVWAKNPEATVILYPSDHFIYPEDRFIKIVYGTVRATEHWTNRMIILGSSPTGMESDYGWIRKRQRLGWANGVELFSVTDFKEKPSSSSTRPSLDGEWLWNTMVVVTKLKTLWVAGWRCFPGIMERFTAFRDVIGTSREQAILEKMYEDMPIRNLSTDLLAKSLDHLAVMEMKNVMWCDWGRPERIRDTLQDIGRIPTFSLDYFRTSPS